MSPEQLLKKLRISERNPRRIDKAEFKRLKKKLEAFPEMLEKRPVVYDSTDDYLVLGGSQRTRAVRDLVKEGKITLKPSYFQDSKEWTTNQKEMFSINDNISEGAWDYDRLANEWSNLPLEEWGINTKGWIKPPDADKEWEGMPEFTGKASFNVFRSLMVHFETEEDYKEFQTVINQNLTNKTKYIWFPFKEKEDVKSQTFVTEKK
jgi:hypothetical protein